MGLILVLGKQVVIIDSSSVRRILKYSEPHLLLSYFQLAAIPSMSWVFTSPQAESDPNFTIDSPLNQYPRIAARNSAAHCSFSPIVCVTVLSSELVRYPSTPFCVTAL